MTALGRTPDSPGLLNGLHIMADQGGWRGLVQGMRDLEFLQQALHSCVLGGARNGQAMEKS